MKVDRYYDAFPPGWGDFVARTVGASLVHSSLFLSYLRQTGRHTVILTFTEGEVLKGALVLGRFDKGGFSFYYTFPMTGCDTFIGDLDDGALHQTVRREIEKLRRNPRTLSLRIDDLSGQREKLIDERSLGKYERKSNNFFLLPIEEPEKMWKEVFNAKLRNSIRKAEKNLTVDFVEEGAQAEELYPLIKETEERHGNKVYSLDHYRELLHCPGIAWLVARWAGKPAVTSLFWRFKKRLYYGINAADNRYRKLQGSDLLMWRAIQLAWDEGIREIDLSGSPSKEGGLYQFKKKWGAGFHEYALYQYKHPLFKFMEKNKWFFKKIFRAY